MTTPLPLQDVQPVSPTPVSTEKAFEKPKLTLVPPTPVPPDVPTLLAMYRAQKRNCWVCEKVAGTLESGKDVSEDDRWHLTSCVLSWEHLTTSNR